MKRIYTVLAAGFLLASHLGHAFQIKQEPVNTSTSESISWFQAKMQLERNNF